MDDDDNFLPNEVWSDGYNRNVGPSKLRPGTKPSAVKSSSRPGKNTVSFNSIARSNSTNAETVGPNAQEKHHVNYPKGPKQYRPLISEGKPVFVDGKLVAESIHGQSSRYTRDPADNAITWVTAADKADTMSDLKHLQGKPPDEHNVGIVDRPPGDKTRKQQLEIYDRMALEEKYTTTDSIAYFKRQIEMHHNVNDVFNTLLDDLPNAVKQPIVTKILKTYENDPDNSNVDNLKAYLTGLEEEEDYGGAKKNRKTKSKKKTNRKTKSKRKAKKMTKKKTKMKAKGNTKKRR
jgi:hypothetical protein